MKTKPLTDYLTPWELREYDDAFRMRDWDTVRYLQDVASGRVPPEHACSATENR